MCVEGERNKVVERERRKKQNREVRISHIHTHTKSYDKCAHSNSLRLKLVFESVKGRLEHLALKGREQVDESCG